MKSRGKKQTARRVEELGCVQLSRGKKGGQQRGDAISGAVYSQIREEKVGDVKGEDDKKGNWGKRVEKITGYPMDDFVRG